ncbi:hypothetical protein GCM10027085_53010 [Spirosoma aerophilum]
MPHYDDGVTPLEETVQGLDDLVRAGKILYVGLANFPAWKAAIMATSLPWRLSNTNTTSRNDQLNES